MQRSLTRTGSSTVHDGFAVSYNGFYESNFFGGIEANHYPFNGFEFEYRDISQGVYENLLRAISLSWFPSRNRHVFSFPLCRAPL